MPHLHAKTRIPLCWKDLIGFVFPLGLEGITSEKHSKGNADPEPHYDEDREVSAKFDNGYVATVGLHSGQSNYFGWLTLRDRSGYVLYEAELEDFSDLDMEYNGRVFHLDVTWE